MKMEIQTQYTMRKTKELKLHKSSLEIYGKNEDVSDLAESIRVNGILVPLTVKPDGVILSGNRRFRAALEAGLEEIPCVIAEPKTPEEEEIFIIEANRNRKKDVYQLYNEGVRLKAAYAALDGRKSAQKTNYSSDCKKDLPPISANLAEIAQAKQPIRKTCSTSAAIANAIGMKDRTWQRLEHIANLAKMGNETAIELLARIDKEDLSISKAERILRQSLKAPAANGELEREKSMFQISIEQAEKNLKGVMRAIDIIIETPDEEYSCFACDILLDDLDLLHDAVEKLKVRDAAHTEVWKAKLAKGKKEDAA